MTYRAETTDQDMRAVINRDIVVVAKGIGFVEDNGRGSCSVDGLSRKQC